MSEIVDAVSDSVVLTESLTMQVVGFVPIFGSVEGADRYWSEQLSGQLWEIQSLDTKTKALITATRAINRLRFAGSKSVETQPLEYPRNGEATLPDVLQQATYEEAMELLKGVDPSTEAGNIWVTRRAFGQVRTDYDFHTAPIHVVHGIASFKAWQLLSPLLSPATGVRLRRWS